MARIAWMSALVLVASCATTQTPAELEAKCQADPGHDERCIGVLTGSPEHYESREEVLKKEASREDDAFQSQLARLRRAEEERQKERLRKAVSSTVAQAGRDPAEDDPLAEIGKGSGEGDEDDSASSVRAIRKARPDELPEKHDASEAKQPDAAVKHPEPPARIVDTAPSLAPTPEQYLRSAACLVGTDVPAIKAGLLAEKRLPAKSRPDQAALGAHALALVEAEGLLGNVRDELRHRGLPEQKVDVKCTTKPLSEVVELLRSLVGPPAAKSREAEGYARGLQRLRSELETRAGLPKAE